ncbi:MAG: hypothetical protein FWF94_05460 [Oscillospiraceae bacterium]|nr:hypothetical protein [Oscillospiraceae bacterium]
MTVNNNIGGINPFANNPVTETNRGGLSAPNQLKNINSVFNGHFDTFVNQVSDNFIAGLNKRIENNLLKIMCLSAEDRKHMAYMYKENLKRLTKEAIEHEEKELERFNSLKKEKAYYEDILSKDGYVDKGKFAFSGIKKTRVSVDEVRELLDKVQVKIDDVVSARGRKESDPFDTKTFEYLFSGAMFLAATDKRSAAAAIIDDVSISGQWTRTEENFAAESKRTKESLEKRLEDIDKMYAAFLKDEEFDERVANEHLGDKMEKVNALLDIFKSWNQKTMLKLLEANNITEEEFNGAFARTGIMD